MWKRFSENRFSREKRASEQALTLRIVYLECQAFFEPQLYGALSSTNRAVRTGDRLRSKNVPMVGQRSTSCQNLNLLG